MAIDIQKVKNERFEMQYFHFGNGPRTAVILPGLSIKSVTESAQMVANAYKLLKEHYTVYVFERRTSCPENYSIHHMAQDTIQALDSLGLQNTFMLGISQGGSIALQIALDRPDLVKKLVIGSSTSRFTSENNAVIENWIRLAQNRNMNALVNSFVKELFTKDFYEKFGEYIVQSIGQPDDAEISRFIILAKACKGFNLYDRLDGIHCPLLIIGARQDRVLGVNASIEMAERTGGQLYIYENYGHAVYDEAPDYKERLLAFFDQ